LRWKKKKRKKGYPGAIIVSGDESAAYIFKQVLL